jgi:hypothetical protein
METALALGDVRSHAAVEALPLPPKAASKVRLHLCAITKRSIPCAWL